MPSLRSLAMCLASPCGMVGIDELLISKKNDQNPKCTRKQCARPRTIPYGRIISQVFFRLIKKKILKNSFSLEKLQTYSAGTRCIDEYLIDGKYRLLNFDHLSSGPPASLERKKVSEIVRQLIE